MATMHLVIDRRRALKDGTFPLVFRVRIDKKFKDIATGFKTHSLLFDEKTSTIIDDFEANFQLEKLKSHYMLRMREYLVENATNISVEELKSFLINKAPKEVTIYDFWNEQIDSLMVKSKLGNARNYKICLSALSSAIDLKVPFSKINYKSIIELEEKLYARGVSTNGISVYMRAFRAMFNKAINLEMVDYDKYPFRKYKIAKQKTSPRVLSIAELKIYFAQQYDREHQYYRSHQIGKLIFMLRGINLRDLLLLSSSNIKGDRIIYKRSKTGRIYSIKLTDEITAVLNSFSANESTLLGVLTEKEIGNKKQFIKICNQKLKVINSNLRKIGKDIKCREEITSYVFRYSFANVCKQLGFSTDLIGEALGHLTGSNTTNLYLEQYDLELVDEMNIKALKAVM